MIVARVVLPSPGGPVQEDVVGCLSPAPGRLEQHGEVGLDLALADVFVEAARPEGALHGPVGVVQQVRREDAFGVVGHHRNSTMTVSHFARLFYIRAARATARQLRVDRQPPAARATG